MINLPRKTIFLLAMIKVTCFYAAVPKTMRCPYHAVHCLRLGFFVNMGAEGQTLPKVDVAFTFFQKK